MSPSEFKMESIHYHIKKPDSIWYSVIYKGIPYSAEDEQFHEAILIHTAEKIVQRYRLEHYIS